jgi:Bacteriocin-protection, YdeI or OmpD-Associated
VARAKSSGYRGAGGAGNSVASSPGRTWREAALEGGRRNAPTSGIGPGTGGTYLTIANQTALDAWNDNTPLARNEFICWVEDAKQDMIRKSRIHRTEDVVGSGQGEGVDVIIWRPLLRPLVTRSSP